MPIPVQLRLVSARDGCRTQGGFSLLELLVVLVIIGLAAGFAVPKFKSRDELVEKTRIRKVVAMLHYARRRAIISGRPQHLAISRLRSGSRADRRSEEMSWTSYGSAVRMAPGSVLGDSGGKTRVMERTTITFFPDGGNTGGRLVIRDSGKETTVVVNPVSGRITLEPRSN